MFDETENPNINPPMPPGFTEPYVGVDDVTNPNHPLNEPPANVDDDGVKHFCTIPPGSEADYCGGCGKPWPCDKAVHLLMLELPQE